MVHPAKNLACFDRPACISLDPSIPDTNVHARPTDAEEDMVYPPTGIPCLTTCGTPRKSPGRNPTSPAHMPSSIAVGTPRGGPPSSLAPDGQSDLFYSPKAVSTASGFQSLPSDAANTLPESSVPSEVDESHLRPHAFPPLGVVAVGAPVADIGPASGMPERTTEIEPVTAAALSDATEPELPDSTPASPHVPVIPPAANNPPTPTRKAGFLGKLNLFSPRAKRPSSSGTRSTRGASSPPASARRSKVPVGIVMLPDGSTISATDVTLPIACKLPPGATLGGAALPEGAVPLPEGTVLLPPKGAKIPAGALSFDDGSPIGLPEGKMLPEGSTFSDGEPVPSSAILLPTAMVVLLPDATTVPAAGVSMPDGSKLPECKLVPHGSVLADGTVVPPNSVVQPDGFVVLPGDRGTVPFYEVTLPDGSQMPNPTSLPPGATMMNGSLVPEGAVLQPDGTVFVPSTDAEFPAGEVVLPDGNTPPQGTTLPIGSTLPDGTLVPATAILLPVPQKPPVPDTAAPVETTEPIMGAYNMAGWPAATPGPAGVDKQTQPRMPQDTTCSADEGPTMGRYDGAGWPVATQPQQGEPSAPVKPTMGRYDMDGWHRAAGIGAALSLIHI